MTKNVIDFPDPLASNEVKDTPEYGYQVATAISNEWFNNDVIQEKCGFELRRTWIREMRNYSRGRQGVDYYQELISRQDEDLSYLNLDWRPDNKAGKYVKLVANGLEDRYYRLNITAVDRLSSDMKVDYRREKEKAMVTRKMTEKAKQMLGVDLMGDEFVPSDQDELDIHMSIQYKPKQEIAEELLLEYFFGMNKWDNIAKKANRDFVECGLGVVKVYTDLDSGVTARYVDIENYGHSYNKGDNDFDDKFYDFEVRTVTVNELRSESVFTDDQLRKIIKKYASRNDSPSYSNIHKSMNFKIEDHLDWTVDVMDFTWKTSKRTAYKKKVNDKGMSKMAKKKSDYDIPNTPKSELVAKSMQTWYEGSHVIGSDFVYNWRESENIVKDSLDRAKSNYVSVATGIYENSLHSFLDDIIPMLDQIHITKLKLQHIIAEIKPNGAEIDFDMLANITGGDKVDYKKILGIFAAKGIVFKKTIADEFGNIKQGRAVEEIHNGIPANLLHLLQILDHQNNELREITGINPSRDGTMPHDALVGIQNAQLMASNTITKDIADASKKLKLGVAEVASLRIADIFRFPEAKDLRKVYERAIGKFNVDILEQIGSIHLHEFGFDIELLPAQEEILKFEESMKIALQAGKIDEDDMMEAREIAKKNIKYAIQYLKVRKKRRMEELMKQKAQETQMKSQSDIAASNAASQNRVKEKKAEAFIDVEKEKALAQIRAMEQDYLNRVNKPVRDEEYNFEFLKKQMEVAATMNLNKFKEDKKDERQNKNNTDQSKMIAQRNLDSGPIDFSESNPLSELLKQMQ